MRVDLGIAGTRLRLELSEEDFGRTLVDAFRPFLSPGPPDVTVRVEIDGRPSPPSPRLLPAAVEEGGRLRLSAPDFEASCSADFREATLRTGPGRFGLESLLKTLLAGRLLAGGGLLIHGVAADIEGRAMVFSGPSGAGKSTLGALLEAEGATLLADELVAVTPDGPIAHGTPWNTGQPRNAPLALAGLLRFAETHRIDPVAPAELLKTLLGNTFVPGPSRETHVAVFLAVTRLLGRLPTVELSFARSPGVAAALAAWR